MCYIVGIKVFVSSLSSAPSFHPLPSSIPPSLTSSHTPSLPPSLPRHPSLPPFFQSPLSPVTHLVHLSGGDGVILLDRSTEKHLLEVTHTIVTTAATVALPTTAAPIASPIP